MGIQARKAKMTLTFREEKPEVFKLRQLTYLPVTYEQLLAECSNSCGVNPTQTEAVIQALVDRLVHYMDIGHGVQLGAFGTFKPTFNSKTARSLKEVTLDTVKVKKIQFYPGKAFKQMLGNMSIVEADQLSEHDPDADPDDGGDGD